MSSYRFDRLHNFRDVGSTINSHTKTSLLKDGVLYRSARPDHASGADRQYLTETLGIKTIIDLRSKTEHINAAKKDAPSIGQHMIHDAPRSKQHFGSSLHISGVHHVKINLNGGSFERALLWQLRYISLFHLLWLMARGYREDAISILGREVMLPRGLTGLGIDTLDYSTNEIRDVFTRLADKSNYPILVHCTQGKDRTGLIVLLVLMLCGVAQDAMRDDYGRSEKELLVEREERLREVRRIGLNEHFAGCPQDFATEITKHIQERFGGIERYLNSIGVDGETQKRVRSIMLQNPMDTNGALPNNI